ncbi:MAG: dTMP kinase [Chloroflexota bacterium]|nr:dTMP kinase [Chloroflexota bacterium]
MPGLFIAFEGGEGAGKTTQSLLLAERLAELQTPHLLVREPGGTELGEYLREYLKSERPLSPEAELLLFEAARVELVSCQIVPALEAGQVVIADRFFGSTIAYQGYGRGLDLQIIDSLNRFAAGSATPDLTILLDLSPEAGIRRAMAFQTSFSQDASGGLAPLERNEEGTRFEDLDLDFHNRARAGFKELAEAQQETWVMIDALGSIESVQDEIWSRTRERLYPEEKAARARPRAPTNPVPQGELWPQAT